MDKANIFDIQRSSLVDGPGIRTVVFFKGCNLRCLWCHNPESWNMQPQHAWYANRCTHCDHCRINCPQGAIDMHFRVDMRRCIQCGRCVNECPTAARKLFGRKYEITEILSLLLSDRDFYDMSGGGVTFSGGECLLHPEPLEELLRGCKNAGIQTAVDTAGNVPWMVIERLLPLIDLFLYDIKCISAELHQVLTGATNERILENYRRIYALAPEKLMVHIPIIPDANDKDNEMIKVADFLTEYPPKSIELLPYHRLGVPKANALDITYNVFSEPSAERMSELKELFASRKLQLL